MLQSKIDSNIDLKNTLINTRELTSLMDREMALATGDVKRETINWVPMWIDWGHAFRSEKAKATAIRAIADTGDLLWYVRHDTKKHGYHSSISEPFQAIAEAEDAWNHRRVVRREWRDVVALSNELLTGRRKFSVTMQDIEDSALCSLGAKGFIKRFRLARRFPLSGRSAALLMKVEPQIGFVIHQAALRDNQARTTGAQTVLGGAVSSQ